MALITCPDCGVRLSDAAPTCPKCGRPMAAGVPVASAPPTAPPVARKTGCGTKILTLIGVLILIGILGRLAGHSPVGSTQSPPPPPADPHDLSPYGRQVGCENAIRSRLKAPTTAKFDSWQENKTGPARYLLRVSVTSQNSFGAMLTGLAVCEVSHDMLTDVRISSP